MKNLNTPLVGGVWDYCSKDFNYIVMCNSLAAHTQDLGGQWYWLITGWHHLQIWPHLLSLLVLATKKNPTAMVVIPPSMTMSPEGPRLGKFLAHFISG